MLRPLYDWTLKQAAKPHAEKIMAGISFAESSFFPIPPDVMLAPMVLTRPEKAYRFALVCTLASVAGAILGYAIGFFLKDFAIWLLGLFGYTGHLDAFESFMATWGPWAILVKGLTPIPFKLVTIASGLGSLNIFIFVLCCAVTRGARFFLVAYLVKRFGPRAQAAIEKRINLIGGIVIALLVLLIVVLKFLH